MNEREQSQSHATVSARSDKKVFVEPKLSYKTPKLQEQGHVNVVVQFGEFTNFS